VLEPHSPIAYPNFLTLPPLQSEVNKLTH
jgi:hypothetical protein